METNKKYILAVVGSRNYNDREVIYKYLDSKKNKINYIVSGGCPRGADQIAQDFCKDRGLSIKIHYPKWYDDFGGYVRAAGFIRNKKIIEEAEIVVAYTTGSKGTQNSIDLAKKLNKKLIVFNVEPDKEETEE